jgi:DNA repair exonuclease SbcCD ATPase subunit
MPRDDDLQPIPSIVPKRDSEQQFATARGRNNKGKVTRKGNGRRSADGGSGGGGTGLLSRLLLTVALVVAAVACAWAWQLQEQLKQTTFDMERSDQRIADLEALLSDTDETVNQSAAAMRAQLRLLDTEVRKLWDARKVSNGKISKLEKSSGSYAGQLSKLNKSDGTNSEAVKALKTDVAKLKGVAGDLERLMASGKRNQAEVERLADALNRYELENSKLEKRVVANEEWVQSINASRRQVNGKITQLEAALRALQTPGQ